MLRKPILLSREQIDAQIWDNHIHHSRQGVIYALSWYLDIVCEQWQALVWPSADDFRIAMPLPVRRRFGHLVLYQPLFCQYLGIFSRNEPDAEHCALFLQALAAHYPYISSYTFNPETFQLMRGVLHGMKCFDIKVLHTHWLDLNRSYEAIGAGYSKDRKLNLKRGISANWQIIESDNFKMLRTLFAENHARRIGRIKNDAYTMLERLGGKCLENGSGRLLYARADARIHAGILLTRYRGQTVYLFNAADNAGRKKNARVLMLDNYFRGNAGAELVFDFESPEKQSIAEYYAGFGAVAMPFYQIRRNALPFPLAQIQTLRSWLIIKTRRCLSAGPCRI